VDGPTLTSVHPRRVPPAGIQPRPLLARTRFRRLLRCRRLGSHALGRPQTHGARVFLDSSLTSRATHIAHQPDRFSLAHGTLLAAGAGRAVRRGAEEERRRGGVRDCGLLSPRGAAGQGSGEAQVGGSSPSWPTRCRKHNVRAVQGHILMSRRSGRFVSLFKPPKPILRGLQHEDHSPRPASRTQAHADSGRLSLPVFEQPWFRALVERVDALAVPVDSLRGFRTPPVLWMVCQRSITS